MRPTASQRVPERARLAGAIERFAEAKAQLDRVEQAIDKIRATRIEDYTGISRAREALKIAAAGRSEILIAAALDEPAPDLPDPKEARAVLDGAEASLDNSRAALKTLEVAAQSARSTLDLAERALKRAVAEVVSTDPKLASLRDEFSRTMATAARLARALHTAGVLGVNHIVELLGGDDPAWTSALAALREDADTPLPDLPPDMPLDHARPGGHKRAAA